MAKPVDCLFLWIQFYWIIAIIDCLYVVYGYFCTTKAAVIVVKRFYGLQSLTYLCDLSWRNISVGHLHLLLQDAWGFSYLQSRFQYCCLILGFLYHIDNVNFNPTHLIGTGSHKWLLSSIQYACGLNVLFCFFGLRCILVPFTQREATLEGFKHYKYGSGYLLNMPEIMSPGLLGFETQTH